MTGWFGLAIGLGALVLTLVNGYQADHWPALVGIALAMLATWTVLVRPVVILGRDTLLLRSILSEVTLPLASIESASIRQFLVVRAGGRNWSCTALSRGRREIAKLHLKGPDVKVRYGDLVEARLVAAVENARALARVEQYSDEQVALASDVRRSWAWPLIGALAVLSVVFVVGVLL
jgi:hypothetical protein